VHIRDATPDDAGAICEVMRRSIAQLCAADHHNDPAILARWLSNKRPDIVAGWAREPGHSLLVAVDGDAVLAVGSVRDSGEITLNYVAPEARFQGVSSALLVSLEARAAERGNTRCTLTSTETAHRFYLSRGYTDEGAPRGNFGTTSAYPMSKQIAARSA
jgi:GNAT superfamily N-acetyltransferase